MITQIYIKQDDLHSSDDQEADISDSLNDRSYDEETDNDNHSNTEQTKSPPQYAMYCDMPQISHHRRSFFLPSLHTSFKYSQKTQTELYCSRECVFTETD